MGGTVRYFPGKPVDIPALSRDIDYLLRGLRRRTPKTVAQFPLGPCRSKYVRGQGASVSLLCALENSRDILTTI